MAMALLGAGAGLAMPAAIGALMSAVPAEHAGVGSALNDTIQQTGGALGVAVLGAILAGTYSGAMPDRAPASARESIAGALGLGDPQLAGLARDAFSSGMQAAFAVGAVSAVVAATVAVFLMRNVKETVGQQDPGTAEALVGTR